MKASLQLQPMYCSRDHNYSSRFNQQYEKATQYANVLVFQDHFMKYVLAYVTPDQTAKTIAKFLYGGFISIFGALARLLSDRGTSFTSSIIRELCEILGVQ